MEELNKLLKSLGYTEEDINKIINTYPILNMKEETLIKNIKRNYKFLLELGYTPTEIIKMTKSMPEIFEYSIETMKQKIEFYDSICLHSLAVMSPKDLMQSTALSYARYMFFKEKGIRIDETNYKKLFYGRKEFERQYGITKEKLLEKYDYKKYLEEKSTQKLVIEAQETIGENISYIDETAQEISKEESQLEEQQNTQDS